MDFFHSWSPRILSLVPKDVNPQSYSSILSSSQIIPITAHKFPQKYPINKKRTSPKNRIKTNPRNKPQNPHIINPVETLKQMRTLNKIHNLSKTTRLNQTTKQTNQLTKINKKNNTYSNKKTQIEKQLKNKNPHNNKD